MMEELEDIWFDTELAMNGLDEYLTLLFAELEGSVSASNINNFTIIEE